MNHNLNPTTTLRYLLFLITMSCFSHSYCWKITDTRGRIDVYPEDNYISTNSCFLVDFKNWKLNLGSSKIIFKAVSSKGKVYNLSRLQSNLNGNDGQILLKSDSLFRQGDTISLELSCPKDYSFVGEAKQFAEDIATRKWIVLFEADTIAPNWLHDSLNFIINKTECSSPNHLGIKFIPEITDITYNQKIKKLSLPMFMEITFSDQRLITSIWKDEYSIHVDNFNFHSSRFYPVILRPIDASGNMPNKHLEFELKKLSGKIRGTECIPSIFIDAKPLQNLTEPAIEKNIEKIEIILDSLAKPSMNAVAYLHQQLKAGLPFLNSDTINAKFMVRLTIEKDGTVSETKVIDIKKILSENDYKMFYLRIKFLIEMLKNQCTWSPGYKNNKPVRSIYKFDLRFP